MSITTEILALWCITRKVERQKVQFFITRYDKFFPVISITGCIHACIYIYIQKWQELNCKLPSSSAAHLLQN